MVKHLSIDPFHCARASVFLPAKKEQAGFTMIELLIVVALIGLMGAMALPSLTGYFKASLNSSTRQMASVVKEAFNSTVMTGRVHRLVFDFEAEQFWAEVGPQTLLMDTAESKEREERRKKFSHDETKSDATFQFARGVTRNKISLPRGVEFEDIITEQSPEPITKGLAYSHFFPHGLTEQTIMHLKDGQGHHITLIVSPLLGRTRMIERYLPKEEAYAQ